jgi:hypothetical protein
MDFAKNIVLSERILMRILLEKYCTVKRHTECQTVVGVVTVQYSAPRFELMSNGIGGVMVSVLASSAVIRGFEHRSGQTKGYEIGRF